MQESDGGGVSLNPTIFKYGDAPAVISGSNTSIPGGNNILSFSSDFNRDGLNDLLTASYTSSNGIDYVSEFKIWNRQSPSSTDYALLATQSLPASTTIYDWSKIRHQNGLLSGDFDGDGLADVLTMKVAPSNPHPGGAVDELNLYRKLEGASPPFGVQSLPLPANFRGIEGAKHWIVTGDFNGDGKKEYLMFLGGVAVADKAFIGQSAAGAWTVSELSTTGNLDIPVSGWQNADKAEVLDFDGDGKEELMLIKDSICEIYTFEGSNFTRVYNASTPNKDHQLHFGDFNGDGKTDLLRIDPNNLDATVMMATGSGFSAHPLAIRELWPGVVDPVGYNRFTVGDFNGDGRSDVFFSWFRMQSIITEEGLFQQEYHGEDLYYSRGDDFTYQQVSYDVEIFGPLFGRASAGSGPITYLHNLPVDLNGDGRADIVSSSGATLRYQLLNPEGHDNRLETVKTGIGYESRWIYGKTVGDEWFFNNNSYSSVFPLTTFNPGWVLAKNLVVSNGAAGTRTFEYGYNGATFHRQGKGFLGFGRVRVFDNAMGTNVISDHQFNTTSYTAVPWQTTHSVTLGSQITQTTMTNVLESAGPKRFWVKTNLITEADALSGVTTTTGLLYDAYANVTKQTVTIPGVHTTVTDTEYGAYPSGTPNKPTLVTVTQTRSGETPFPTKTRLDYNSLGQLTSRIDFYQQSKAVTTTYGYNSLGNQTAATISASGMTTRSMGVVYDSKGRYPEQTTNALSQQSSAAHDPKWGTPLTVTSVEGLTTTYLYDSWGRLAKTTFPEGYDSEVTLHWDVNNEQRFYRQAVTGGQPTTKTWFDQLGREIRTETEGFDGQWSIQTQSYDVKGNLHMATEPHYGSESYNSTTYYYDDYNRLRNMDRYILGTTTYTYSYSGGRLTVTTTSPAGTTSQTTDAAGMLTGATDDGGTLSYSYYSHGGLKTVTNGGVTLTSHTYDAYGRQTGLTDVNAGTTEYEYDALGLLTWQKNANNKETTLQYNLLGQVTSRTGVEGPTSYVYGTSNSGGEIKNKIKTVTGFAGTSTSYTYNGLGQLTQLTENNDGSHTTGYTYNIVGDVSTVSYPSGLVITNQYNSRGYMEEIKNGVTVLYKTEATNGQGQVTQYKRANNNITSNISYTNGFPTAYTTAGLQDYHLVWDYQKGTVTSRQDVIKGKTESFTYDNLQRLTGAHVSGGASISAHYYPNGNLNTKTDAGTYSYHASKIHAVTGVTNPAPAPIPTLQQDIAYTPFMQPETVTENNYSLTYTYGADYNRSKAELKQGGTTINTRYYFEAGYEKDISSGTTRYIQYIAAPAGLVALIESNSGSHTVHYTYTDHLGSILTVSNPSGTIEAEQSFDAWGRRRDVNSWALLPPTAATSLPAWLYRGYTGHEHLDQFGLVNMNGRMYDPVVGRMLSPDNYVPDLLFSQDYNRYSYARNNPLVYTDPDGEFWHIVIGAALGGGINLGVQAALGKVHNFGDGLRAFGKGALIGGMAAVGCASCSVGTLALGSALAVGNSYIPSYNIPLGNSGFSMSLGVSAGFGSTGLFAGGNVGLSYSSESFSAGMSYGIGYNFRDNITGKSGWGQSYGGGAIVGGNDFRVGLFTNQFKGRGLDQRTGTFYLESNGWSISYENDWMFGVPISDGGDRFRTTGVRIAKGDFSIGLNLFTGDPGVKKRETIGHNEINNYKGTYKEITQRYRLGALYGSYKGYRAGWNSERIRDSFQNKLAHGNGYKHPLFEVLKIKGAPYINYYQTGNRFTTWH